METDALESAKSHPGNRVSLQKIYLQSLMLRRVRSRWEENSSKLVFLGVPGVEFLATFFLEN